MMTVKFVKKNQIPGMLQSFQSRLNGKKGSLYKHLSTIIAKSIDTNFKHGGRAPKWRKREKSYSHPILSKTREMRLQARDSAKGTDGGGWKFAGTIRYLRITGPEYGYYHQYGSKKTNLPIRKYVKFTAKERLFMINLIRLQWNAAWQEQQGTPQAGSSTTSTTSVTSLATI